MKIWSVINRFKKYSGPVKTKVIKSYYFQVKTFYENMSPVIVFLNITKQNFHYQRAKKHR